MGNWIFMLKDFTSRSIGRGDGNWISLFLSRAVPFCNITQPMMLGPATHLILFTSVSLLFGSARRWFSCLATQFMCAISPVVQNSLRFKKSFHLSHLTVESSGTEKRRLPAARQVPFVCDVQKRRATNDFLIVVRFDFNFDLGARGTFSDDKKFVTRVSRSGDWWFLEGILEDSHFKQSKLISWNERIDKMWRRVKFSVLSRGWAMDLWILYKSVYSSLAVPSSKVISV